MTTCQSQPGDKLKGFSIWYKDTFEKTKNVIKRLQSIGAQYVEIIEGEMTLACSLSCWINSYNI